MSGLNEPFKSKLFLFGPLKYLEISVTKKNIIGRGVIEIIISLVLDKGVRALGNIQMEVTRIFWVGKTVDITLISTRNLVAVDIKNSFLKNILKVYK